MFSTKASLTKMRGAGYSGVRWLVWSFVFTGLMFAASSVVAGDDDDDITDYTVEDGKVDQATFDGYEAYTRVCQSCHGPDGLGSSFAPSLMDISQSRTLGEFAATVANGQEIQPGQVMPSFADDEYVMNNVNNIYRYLTARAEGDLGRGRPDVIGEEQGDDKNKEEEESDNGSEE